MSGWVPTLLEWLFKWWLGRARRQAIFKLRAKGVETYLRFLQGLRLSAAGMITALLILQLIGFGMALMVTAGVFLLPWSLETKLWAVFAVGAALFLLPVIGLSFLLSQKLWYRASGAEQMVNDLLADRE